MFINSIKNFGNILYKYFPIINYELLLRKQSRNGFNICMKMFLLGSAASNFFMFPKIAGRPPTVDENTFLALIGAGIRRFFSFKNL